MNLSLGTASPFTCPGCGGSFRSLHGEPEPGRLCTSCAVPALASAPLAREVDPLEAAGVPRRFRRGWSLEQWRSAFGAVPPALGEWAGEPPLVLLWGNAGTGKTGMGTLLLSRLVGESRVGFWIRGQALLRALKGSIGLGPGPEAHLAEAERRALQHRALHAPGLVVDDLFAGQARQGSGETYVSPWVLGEVLEILAHRYDEELPTLVTTMLRPPQLAQIDYSLFSRLTDASGLQVELTGPDRRQEAPP